MGSIIVIASGKGGTGKTTVCAGLASALALLGRKVVAVDCDIGLRNLDLALGLGERVLFDFDDVLKERIPLEDALIVHDRIKNLKLLPAPSHSEDNIDRDKFKKLMEEISKEADYCLIDAPAGIDKGFMLAAYAADRALIVSTPDTPCIMDSGIAARKLWEMGIEDVKLVLNRVLRKRIRKKDSYNIDESIDGVGLVLAGIIFEDSRVAAAFNRSIPMMLSKSKVATENILDLAKRLEGFPVRPKF